MDFKLHNLNKPNKLLKHLKMQEGKLFFMLDKVRKQFWHPLSVILRIMSNISLQAKIVMWIKWQHVLITTNKLDNLLLWECKAAQQLVTALLHGKTFQLIKKSNLKQNSVNHLNKCLKLSENLDKKLHKVTKQLWLIIQLIQNGFSLNIQTKLQIYWKSGDAIQPVLIHLPINLIITVLLSSNVNAHQQLSTM